MSPRSPASHSDGEVSSSEDGEKVTRNAPHRKNTVVDSSARHTSSSRSSRPSGRDGLMSDRHSHFTGYGRDQARDRSRSPYRRDRSGSRSPYRAAKDTGREKRRHQDDHYGKSASDPRRHKVYEDKPARAAGLNTAYHDLDRPSHPSSGLPYDGKRGRVRANTRDLADSRDRSRSPYRAPPSFSNVRPHSNHDSSRPAVTGNEDDHRRHESTRSAQRESTPQALSQYADSKITSSRPAQQAHVVETTGKASEQAEEQAEPEAKLSEAELIEQRRKKREAIRKKHAASATNDSLLRTTLESNIASTTTTPRHDSSNVSEQHSPPSSANSPGTPNDGSSAPGSPAPFTTIRDEDLVNPLQVNASHDEQEQSAADYDPNQDMNEDRPEFKRQDVQETAPQLAAKAEPETQSNGRSKKAAEFDMFAEDDDDDDDDMFAVNDTSTKHAGSKQARALDESLLDNWDYPDGHYRIINGELLAGRYAVEQQVGKGTFATVVRARDTQNANPEKNKVAIKIACRNDTMLKAGQKEMQFLNRLNQRDSEDKRHIIRLLGDFTHKGHLCLVFEGLHMDLREVLKKFGRDVGISLDAVKIYAFQMFQGLLHMKSAEVLHADLKPDNILISEDRKLIKICDFGTATLQQDAELTPYLVSRFYRAPEVILGMDFDYAIDMWAIGCTLYELYAGRILFNGSDNNNMLRVIQECRGKLPNRLIKRAKLADKYFDEAFTFYGLERDKMTGNIVHRAMHFAQGVHGRDLKSRLSGNVSKMKPDVLKEHNAFVDLLDKCLQLDPEKRIKPREALHHHFFARPGAPAKPKAVGSMAAFRPISVQHSG